MFLEFKKYELRFDGKGVPSLKSKEDGKIIPSSSIGWVYNYGPPHDHNWNWKEVFLEEIDVKRMDKIDRDVRVCVESDCDTHKDQYCTCSENRVPVSFNGRVIIDLYNLVSTISAHTIILHT